MDGKEWIECSLCEKWNHTECELARTCAEDRDMQKVAADFGAHVEQENADADPDYWCLSCRNKRSIQT